MSNKLRRQAALLTKHRLEEGGVLTPAKAVVKGSQHMLLEDAIAPRSADPIAAAAGACYFRGLALIHDDTVGQGHSFSSMRRAMCSASKENE